MNKDHRIEIEEEEVENYSEQNTCLTLTKMLNPTNSIPPKFKANEDEDDVIFSN